MSGRGGLDIAVDRAAARLCDQVDPCPEHRRMAREVIGTVIVMLSAEAIDCYQQRLNAGEPSASAVAMTMMLMSQRLLPAVDQNKE